MSIRVFKCLLICLVIVMLVSCAKTPSLSSEDRINTSVAQTVAAAQPPGMQLPTQGAAEPVNTAPAPAEQATLTPVPLPTLAPPTATVTASPTPDTCNQARFIEDVTVVDGTRISPSAAFTKTWRIQNTGTCTWNTNYAVVYDGGHSTGAPTATQLLTNVPPGGTIDVSVVITAPAANGDYTWNFKLRSDSGRVFGFGAGYAYPMTAVIKVAPVTLLPLAPGAVEILPLESVKYDFIANYCTATWQNGHGTTLPCPGADGDSAGFVIKKDNPKLQDGVTQSVKSLLTHPEWVDDGRIVGFYPGIAIESGYRLKATLGCGYGGSNCDVYFRVDISSGTGPALSLGSWRVQYSAAPVQIDIDLSPYAGSTLDFRLSVSTNGSSAQDWAHWLKPRIVK